MFRWVVPPSRPMRSGPGSSTSNICSSGLLCLAAASGSCPQRMRKAGSPGRAVLLMEWSIFAIMHGLDGGCRS